MGTKVPQVDTHFHIWDQTRFKNPSPPAPQLPNLKRDVTIDEYEENRKTTPIEYSVFLQVHNCNPEEADWLLSLAEKYPALKGIVPGLDLTGPQLKKQLTKFKANGKVVGVRHLLDCEDDAWILRDDVQKGLGILQDMDMTYDWAIRPQRMAYAVEVSKKFPRLKFVVNHIGMPDMKGPMNEVWKRNMVELGKLPNVYCKISGLVSDADPKTWKTEDFREHVEHTLKCFGVDKCMYGSDWPIGLGTVGATYREVYDVAQTLLSHLTEADREKIFGLNAIRFYGLDIPT